MNPTQRRDALRAKLDAAGADALLVTKPENIRYLTGFTGSDGHLLLGAEDAFLTDSRYEEQASRQVTGCRREIYRAGRAWPLLAGLLRGERLAVEAHVLTVAAARRLAAALPNVAIVETEGLVEKLREVKDPSEVDCMRRAAAVADAALERVLPRVREGMTEADLAADLDDEMRRCGSEAISFPTIAAFGESAAEPHHEPTVRALRRSDVIKLDFGATVDGYHSDMTRTFALGDPPDELCRIHGVVLAAQQRAIEAVRAGVACSEIDAIARAVLDEHGYGFGHGTGHGCGLEVHEAPGLRKESVDILAAGMTVTVEPGVYVPGLGGVRIEDLVVVGEDGCESLTRSPRDLIRL